jgi:hypothetical protein
MREIRPSGSVRGVRRKPYPYRDEINPVRSAERDVRCWYDPGRLRIDAVCARSTGVAVEDPPLMSRVLPQRI